MKFNNKILFDLIIWKGKGLLVILALILGLIINSVFSNIFSLNTQYKLGFILYGIIITLLVALINYILTKKFVSTEVRTFIDEETGERIQVKDGSSFFFIPNKYWTFIILVLGILFTISESTHLY